MDHDDRFVPLAFAGGLTTAFAATIASCAGDLQAATSFALACVLCIASFVQAADAADRPR